VTTGHHLVTNTIFLFNPGHHLVTNTILLFNRPTPTYGGRLAELATGGLAVSRLFGRLPSRLIGRLAGRRPSKSPRRPPGRLPSHRRRRLIGRLN
jgi:hypothetical protein